LYVWIKKFSKPRQQRENETDLRAENARLKRELRRAQQERDILKEAAVFFAGESKSATRS
jgi:transposase